MEGIPQVRVPQLHLRAMPSEMLRKMKDMLQVAVVPQSLRQAMLLVWEPRYEVVATRQMKDMLQVAVVPQSHLRAMPSEMLRNEVWTPRLFHFHVHPPRK